MPDIITVEEVKRIFAATRVVSYRVLFFTLHSLGLRLGEGLRLQVGDIDAVRGRVHIRDAKGNRDRFVPLPQATHHLLQRFWQVHRNPVLLFPNRHSGLISRLIAPWSAVWRGCLGCGFGDGCTALLAAFADHAQVIVKTRIRSVFSGVMPMPIATPGAH